jgi:hypothetical protein
MANLYDKAGLVNIPVGYQEGFLYNIKPTDDTLAFRFNRDSAATRVNKEGLIEEVLGDKPRIDYTDSLTSPSFLLEPQSTNLLPYSSNLTTWNGAAMTKTFVNDLVNPSNVLGGSKLSQNSSGGYAWLSRTFTGNETFSAFVKKDSSNFVRLFAANNTVYFDIVNGTIETEVGSDITDKSIINYGNGWFRISMSVNSTAASYVRIYPASSGSSSSGTNSLFVYGAQLEQGSYATSYIPTYGSTTTRNAELCNNSGSAQDFNSEEGVLYCDIAALADDLTFRGIAISDGTSDNRVMLRYRTTSNQINLFINANGTNIVNSTKTLTDITNYSKFALKYKSGDIALWIDGQEAKTHTQTFTLIGLNTLSFNAGQGSDAFYGKTKGVYVFNEALTDDELQQLTT